MKSMKCVVATRTGGPEVLSVESLSVPEPGPGEVRLKVHAAALNPVDYKMMRKAPSIAEPPPRVVGCDVAGVVDALGSGVSSLRVGDSVFGCAGGFRGMQGSLAEYMCAPASLLVASPSACSLREAAAVPLVGITAWEALFCAGKATGQDSVLVHAGAGGVGHMAIQLAALTGAQVATTVSSEAKEQIVQGLAPVEVIRYTRESPQEYTHRLTGDEGFDLVFDTVGGSTLALSFEAARAGGRVVGIALRAELDLTRVHEKELSLSAVFMVRRILDTSGHRSHRKILSAIARLMNQGRLKALLDPQTFTLDSAADAFRHLESGSAVGKVVVDVARQ